MNTPNQFADLQIRILEPMVPALTGDEQNGKQSTVYPIEITLNGTVEFYAGQLSKAALQQWQPDGSDPVRTGRALFNLLLGNDTVRSTWFRVQGMYPRRRVRLRVDFAAPELNAIPWEMMIEDPQQTTDPAEQLTELLRLKQLAASSETPFLRYQTGSRPPMQPLIERPIKMLVVIANPRNLNQFGLAKIDGKEELKLLRAATAALDIELTEMENCTIQALEAKLRNGYHILHFIGHGAYDEKTREAMIYMADDEQNVHLVSAQFEASLIARQYANDTLGVNALRLVCLFSCQSATRDPGDAFRGFAPKLIAAGVPAVIAMQDLISVEAAQIFAATFYRRLLEHGLVDLACNEARSALVTAGSTDVHVPVLYTRLSDGKLFAPDPIFTTLQSMLNAALYQPFEPDADQFLNLPIEVTHRRLNETEITDSSWENIHAFATMQLEQTASIKIRKIIEQICTEDLAPVPTDGIKSKVILLIGDHGSGKSTQLRYLAWKSMRDALAYEAEAEETPITTERQGVKSDTVVIPIYVDLQSYPEVASTLRSPAEMNQIIELLILQTLQPHWPGINLAELKRQLRSRRFRFLFVKGEYLSEPLRTEVLQRISTFIYLTERNLTAAAEEETAQADHSAAAVLKQPPRGHEFIITLSPSGFKRQDTHWFTDNRLGLNIHLLIIQRLAVSKIRHFLKSERKPYALPLLRQLDSTGLYDMAAIPWFFVDMVERAKAGQVPQTRVELLRSEVQDAITRLGHNQGIRFYAFDALCVCAWKMMTEFRETLTLPEVFDILGMARRNRDFSLEIFYNRLVETRLLTNIGSGEVRFTYDRVRAYCAAYALVQKSNCTRLLDNIVATLSRLSYLNWWQDTIIYACGLLVTKPTELGDLLQSLVYGSNLLESEQIFVAAHCLLETLTVLGSQRQPAVTCDVDLQALVDHMNGALLWRLNKENEPNPAYRDRAAILLGYLVPMPDSHLSTAAGDADAAALDARLLAQTAYKPQPGNDIGSMNWAAVLAFLRVNNEERQTKLLTAIDPELAQMMGNWINENFEPISKQLNTTVKDRNIQGIAALALADLYNVDPYAANAEVILNVLVDAFYTFTDEMTLWSITHALATMDTITIVDQVIRGYGKEVNRRHLTPDRQWSHRKYFTYLIGLLRVQEAPIHQQLLDNFQLAKTQNRPEEITELIVETINAIGRLAVVHDKELLEKLVGGDFIELIPHLGCDVPDARIIRARAKIQRAAVDALAAIGDIQSVNALRKLRKEITWKTLTTNGSKRRRPKEGPITIFYRELNLAIDRTADTIYWRTNWQRIHEYRVDV